MLWTGSRTVDARSHLLASMHVAAIWVTVCAVLCVSSQGQLLSQDGNLRLLPLDGWDIQGSTVVGRLQLLNVVQPNFVDVCGNAPLELWDTHAAKVACQSLQYSNGTALLGTSATFNRSVAVVHCSGLESSLKGCNLRYSETPQACSVAVVACTGGRIASSLTPGQAAGVGAGAVAGALLLLGLLGAGGWYWHRRRGANQPLRPPLRHHSSDPAHEAAAVAVAVLAGRRGSFEKPKTLVNAPGLAAAPVRPSIDVSAAVLAAQRAAGMLPRTASVRSPRNAAPEASKGRRQSLEASRSHQHRHPGSHHQNRHNRRASIDSTSSSSTKRSSGNGGCPVEDQPRSVDRHGNGGHANEDKARSADKHNSSTDSSQLSAHDLVAQRQARMAAQWGLVSPSPSVSLPTVIPEEQSHHSHLCSEGSSKALAQLECQPSGMQLLDSVDEGRPPAGHMRAAPALQ